MEVSHFMEVLLYLDSVSSHSFKLHREVLSFSIRIPTLLRLSFCCICSVGPVVSLILGCSVWSELCTVMDSLTGNFFEELLVFEELTSEIVSNGFIRSSGLPRLQVLVVVALLNPLLEQYVDSKLS